MSDIPNIEVQVVSIENPLNGAGEDGLAARSARSGTRSWR